LVDVVRLRITEVGREALAEADVPAGRVRYEAGPANELEPELIVD